MTRPVALVTGVGRRAGLGAAIAVRLATVGYDVATTHWSAYDERMPWGTDPMRQQLEDELRTAGAATVTVEADLTRPGTAAEVLDRAGELGPVTRLVMAHCESVDADLMGTTVESLDRHHAVNVRASLLLIQAFAERFPDDAFDGRIVALTSDHVVGNVPYGATKGALDRIVIAAATELGHRGITANVLNPGPVDTGWMDEGIRDHIRSRTALGRLGTAGDTADLVEFLCSAAGGWVTGQLLRSDGGLG